MSSSVPCEHPTTATRSDRGDDMARSDGRACLRRRSAGLGKDRRHVVTKPGTTAVARLGQPDPGSCVVTGARREDELLSRATWIHLLDRHALSRSTKERTHSRDTTPSRNEMRPSGKGAERRERSTELTARKSYLLHLDFVRVVRSSSRLSCRCLHPLLRNDRERSAVPDLAEPGRVAPLVQRQAHRVELRDRSVKPGLVAPVARFNRQYGSRAKESISALRAKGERKKKKSRTLKYPCVPSGSRM